jgi:hypothetical protein
VGGFVLAASLLALEHAEFACLDAVPALITTEPGQPTHRHHQSNPRLLAGARHRSTARPTLLAIRIATHSRHAARRALTRMARVIEGLADDWRMVAVG